VVYDTNVMVSAVLKPGSIPASLVALALTGRVQLCVSSPILAEYRDVLHRPKFGFEARRIDAFLAELAHAALPVDPSVRLAVAPDEADNRFLECALEARAEFFVTGNLRHFPSSAFQGIVILEPARFAQVLAGSLLP
jgi:uncharacterized protein